MVKDLVSVSCAHAVEIREKPEAKIRALLNVICLRSTPRTIREPSAWPPSEPYGRTRSPYTSAGALFRSDRRRTSDNLSFPSRAGSDTWFQGSSCSHAARALRSCRAQRSLPRTRDGEHAAESTRNRDLGLPRNRFP